ncbi:hypothetical protein [Dyadobacter sp. CY312]|uniref:hypothetical protein n=1 Tax=Dyadobacter sp. CY312 TaxID=2907303 RepID=UPI001F24A74B|nr:hypothetical protein [Dyadobacter sp. CY312]MCE7043582.1 hypothetical protein [Dyadobacter sp. CY312]
MQTTYHIKASDVNTSLIADIKSQFRGEEVLTITVSSEQTSEALDPVYRFLELEKKYPPKRVSNDLDFNSIVNEMNG